MVDKDALTMMLEQLRTEQSEAESELVQLQHRVGWLRQAVTGIEGLLGQRAAPEDATKPSAVGVLPDAAPVQSTNLPPAGRPRGAEAVRRVFAESEGHGWTVQEMTEEFERRGWTPDSNSPADAVRAAMMRALHASDGTIKREGSRFIYRPDRSPSRNGDGPADHEEVSGDQEVSGAAPTFTEGEQQP
jgi:hypothetical protein